MDPKALSKAQGRLRVAQKQVAELSDCQTYQEFSDIWYVFLHAAKGIYTTLEQGAKASAQARQWYGGKNQERKSDPLLRYVTEARNDDEHGIEQVTEYVPGAISLGVATPGSSTRMTDENGNVFIDCGAAYHFDGITGPVNLPKLRALDGKPIANRLRPPQPRLVAVFDRSKNRYEPPTTHLGQSLVDVTPFAVSKLMVAYLEGLLAEAEDLRTP